MKVGQLIGEFQTLQKIQKDIYSAIERRQGDLLRQMSDRELLKMKQKSRKQEIRKKTNPEIVKHPYNNHIWVPLANFINDQDQLSLTQIENRKKERQRIRLEMEAKRLARVEAEKQIVIDPFEEPEPKKESKKKTKASWKLMRELRKQEVQENKERLRRIQENKREKMSYYHKY